MKEDEVNTTGGKVKRQPIPGIPFEGQPTIESKREAELLKAREAIDQELEGIRDARGKAEFEKSPEGKKWQKQWEETQETIRQQRAEGERIYKEEVLPEARRNFILNRLADDLLKKEKVNEKDPAFEKVLQRIRDIRNMIWSARQGRR
ncbi:hypothetical protein ES705_33832 [subsurface metagenome]